MLQAGHPDEGVLESYCMSKLEGDPLDTFEEHLLICPECQDRVTATDSFLRGMRSALAAPQLHSPVSAWHVLDWSTSRWNPSRWNVLPYFEMPAPVWAAAAVAVAALLGFVVSHNLNLKNPPLAIALTATRGGAIPVAKAGASLDLNLDVRELAPVPNNPVQIVNADGTEVWSGSVSAVKDGHVHALVQERLSPGQYYVRISGAAGAHREYALRVGK